MTAADEVTAAAKAVGATVEEAAAVEATAVEEAAAAATAEEATAAATAEEPTAAAATAAVVEEAAKAPNLCTHHGRVGVSNISKWTEGGFDGGPHTWCSAAAQWAVAGGAPAPQLNDRSQPPPQGGDS